jgi:chaperonin GroEL
MPKQVMFSDEDAPRCCLESMSWRPRSGHYGTGRNVVIDKKFGSPTITKDGVTVAKEIELKDNYEDMGARTLKEVAPRPRHRERRDATAADRPGRRPRGSQERDGRQSHGAQAVSTDGPGGRRAEEDIMKSTKDKKEIAQVATIASNNDKTISNLIAEAMEKVGEDHHGRESSPRRPFRRGRGMQFDRGYSRRTSSRTPSAWSACSGPLVLIHEKKISVMKDMLLR